MKILDKYFNNPISIDLLIAAIVTGCIFILIQKDIFNLPKTERSISMISDISNIGFTSAGFILTLLTVLITFKSGSSIKKNNYDDNSSLFELFFATNLYFTTVKILKNAIKSLIVVSVLGYALKIGLSKEFLNYTFYFNVSGLTIVSLTLYRCLLILSKIMKMQEQ